MALSLTAQFAEKSTGEPNMVPVADVRNTSPGFSALIDRATGSSSHVMIGEPHRDGMTARTYGLLADNPEAFQSAARNGVKHFVVELPSDMQSDVDAFMSGEISRDEMKNRLNTLTFPALRGDDVAGQKDVLTENMTRAFENAKDAGLSVHFVDTSSGRFSYSDTPVSIQQKTDELTREYMRLYPEEGARIYAKQPDAIERLQDFMVDKFEEMPEQERQRLAQDLSDLRFNSQVSRSEADLEVYGLIRERIPPGEGMIGIFGSHHLDNNKDFRAERTILGIDDLLEEEGATVTTIEMESNESARALREYDELNGLVPLDPPDFKVNVDEGTINDRGKNPVGTLEGGLTTPSRDAASVVSGTEFKAQTFNS